MLSFYQMVGQRIIERLNELEWTQQNLADRLSISKQVMSKILNGEKKTTILEIRNIADILNISVDRLFNPINQKIELVKEEEYNLVPEFMGKVSTKEGYEGLEKAMYIIDTILNYNDDYNSVLELRKKRIDFTGVKRKRTFKPNV